MRFLYSIAYIIEEYSYGDVVGRNMFGTIDIYVLIVIFTKWYRYIFTIRMRSVKRRT